MKDTFVKILEELMKKDKKIFTITADMGYNVFESIQEKFPDRFLNTGITEQASTSFAAGLSLAGYEVYFYAQAPFITMRNFEQIRLDLVYNHLNVKLIGTNAGFSLNQLGTSHFGIEDVSLMRTLSGMTVFTPGDFEEVAWCMKKAHTIVGPVYMRLTKNCSHTIHSRPIPEKEISPMQIIKGNDGIFFVSGGLLDMAKQIVIQLKKNNINISLYSVPQIKPFPINKVKRIIKNLPVFTLEEHSLIGGLGSLISNMLTDMELSNKLKKFAFKDEYIHVSGSTEYLLKKAGIDTRYITKEILKKFKIYEKD